MLQGDVRVGTYIFISLLPYSLALACALTGVRVLLKRFTFRPVQMLGEFMLIWTILAILQITGIKGGDFHATSPFDGTANVSLGVLDQGFTGPTILNIFLFVPFGFFWPMVFWKGKKSLLFGLLAGMAFSVLIEALQMFTGRLVQTEDVLMNALGTGIGCAAFGVLAYFAKKLKPTSKE